MLVIIPIYLVIKNFYSLAIAVGVLGITSIILKFTWYDKLKYVDNVGGIPGNAKIPAAGSEINNNQAVK